MVSPSSGAWRKSNNVLSIFAIMVFVSTFATMDTVMDLHVELYEACAGGDVTTFENALTRHYVEMEKTDHHFTRFLQTNQTQLLRSKCAKSREPEAGRAAYPPLIPTQSWAKRTSVLVVCWYFAAEASCAGSTYPCAIRRSSACFLDAPGFSAHFFMPQPLTMSHKIASSSLLMVTTSVI